MTLRPLGDRVIVKPAGPGETTSGGIMLPDTAKERPQQGTVLAVGPGPRNNAGERVPLDVSVGDTVLYAKYAGTEVKVDGEKVLVLTEDDILAIVE